MIYELGISITTSISGLAVSAFWKRALNIYIFMKNFSPKHDLWTGQLSSSDEMGQIVPKGESKSTP